MAKPKLSTTSKVKLANKSTNKRMKSKRKHKVNPCSALQKQVNMASMATLTKGKKEGKEKRKPAFVDAPQGRADQHEMSEDDLEFSDEEMLNFINENSQKLTLFTTADLSNSVQLSKKKYKEKDADYEKTPRYFSKMAENDGVTDTKVELLPIKGDRGLIQRSRQAEVAPPIEETEEEGVVVPDVEQSTVTPLSVIEILANFQAEVNQKKVKIAHLSQDVVENPEKVGSVKELLKMCGREQVISIRKLALLSLLEVFKDVIPSYRIRELTEQELAIKVSRDVCALREFENSLLSSYQLYLTVLEDNIKDCTRLLKKKKRDGTSESVKASLKPLLPIAITSAKCLCELLKAVPHFNFRSNIIAVVVPKIELLQEMREVGLVCANGIKAALNADKVGDVSLDVVKVINKVVKSKIHVKPQLLQVLLSLQINAEAIKSAEQRGNKMERLKKKKEAIMKLSRKEKKRKKVEDQLNKEMQEAEAVENKDRVERLQTEILKFLFVIYFRVLKAEHTSSLLPPVLQGLAKFSHLISVDFFDDLMAALENILKNEDLGLNESLNCIRTGVKVLSGQGEVLTIDPKQFYTELYNRLLLVAADGAPAEVEMAKQCVEDLILKRRKQVSMGQVTGYFKRLTTILLQLKSAEVLEYSLLVRSILQMQKKCDYLLDNDTCSRGSFEQEIPDPEYCNAEGSTVWELTLLTSHYHPHLNIIAKHLMDGAPSQGVGSLPSKILTRNAVNSKKENEDLHTYFPDFIPPKPTSKCKYNTNNNIWTSTTLQSLTQQYTSLTDGSVMNLDNLFPTAKRKKCNVK